MKKTLPLLLIASLAAGPGLAQTKTPAKTTTTTKTTATKAGTTTTKTTTASKPTTTAKPAATKTTVRTTTTSKPGTARPTTTKTTTTARPAAAPAPAPAPAAQPAPAPATPPKASAKSSNTGFSKGTVAVNLGVGLGLGYGYGFGYGGALKSTPALSLSVEKGIVEGVGPGIISVGALVGYRSTHYDWSLGSDEYKARWTNIIVAARGAYHYNFTSNPKLDTYAGISLGARIENYNDNYSGITSSSYGGAYLTSGIFLGGRYFFSDNVGAFAELGYDMSVLKLGLSAKF